MHLASSGLLRLAAVPAVLATLLLASPVRGQAKPEDVLKAVEEGDPPAREKDFRLFYAHLYLGLWFEVTGDAPRALRHLSTAAEKPRVHPYMWDVARVHRDLLRAKKPQVK